MKNDAASINKTKDFLKSHFEIKVLDELSHTLRIQIIRDRKSRTLHLSQEQYFDKIFKKFYMDSLNSIDSPIHK